MPREKIQLPIVLGCVISRGEVLLIRRYQPDIPAIHNKWEFPGGKIEFGENSEKAVEREILEETGNVVRAIHLLPFTYVAVRETEMRRICALVMCYRCELRKRETLAKLPHKVAEVAWTPVGKIDPIVLQSGTFQFLRHVALEEGVTSAQVSNGPTVSYLHLQSVDATENRRRGYSITIESDLLGNFPFRVHLTWGRLPYHQFRNHKVEEFERRDDAMKHVENVLIKRKNHVYVVTRKSANFPSLPVLNEMLEHSVDSQSTLF